MNASIEVKDNVIIRCFKGDVYIKDIIKSWREIFTRFDVLGEFKGIVTDLTKAKMHHTDKNLNILVEHLKGYLNLMEGMKIAMVTNKPQVTNTIMMDQKMKHLQIRPFSSRKTAMTWIAE